MKTPQVDIGYFTVPVEYLAYNEEERKQICDKIIDSIYKYIDKNLEPDINRILFLEEIFESSIITNEQDENYEMCIVLKDCLTRLNED
jgi:hypothetical protein